METVDPVGATIGVSYGSLGDFGGCVRTDLPDVLLDLIGASNVETCVSIRQLKVGGLDVAADRIESIAQSPVL